MRNDNYQSLSQRQVQVWQGQEIAPNNPVFNVSCALKITLTDGIAQLESILRKLIERHPVIDSRIDNSGIEAQLAINVATSTAVCWQLMVGENMSDAQLCDVYNSQVIDIKSNNFEFYYKALQNDDVLVLVKGHHIVCDQWSLQILINDLLRLLVLKNEDETLEPDIEYYTSKEFAPSDASAYPVDFINRKSNNPELAGKVSVLLDNATDSIGAIKQVAAEHGISPYCVILASTLLTVSRLTNDADITIGVPIARRTRKNRYLLGHFVDLEALTVENIHDKTLLELLNTVNDKLSALLLTKSSSTLSSKNINVVCNYLAQLKTAHIIPELMLVLAGLPDHQIVIGDEQDMVIEGVPLTPVAAQFDLDFTLFEAGSNLWRKVVAEADQFSCENLAQIGDVQTRFIAHLAEDKAQVCGQISTLTDEQKLQIEELWNGDRRQYPTYNLIDGFNQQVASHPKHIAVITSTEQTDYQTLSAYRFGIAHALTEQSASRGSLVAVICEKGAYQVASLLAINTVACAYLPINVAWPNSRIHQVLVAGGVEHLLVSDTLYERLKDEPWLADFKITHVQAAAQNSELANEQWQAALVPPATKEIAYVIFTSGSTGQPKGVVITHESAMNTIFAINERFNVTDKDRIFAISDLSFDLSVYDIFGALAVGAAMVMPDQDKVQDTHHWLQMVDEHQVTIWDSVPQLAQLLADEQGQQQFSAQNIRVYMMSGDWIPLRLPEQLLAINPQADVMSLGGATEGSIWSIWYPVKAVDPNWQSIPYGLAMPNQAMWVLDKFGNHCPPGIMGEIHIGGIGVAQGYFNDPERTALQYFEHPTLGRLYRTGDNGAWNAKGYIEFKGRKDFQVKIRGFRIEMGEIEHCLLKRDDIKHVAVIDKTHNGQKILVAYLVPEGQSTLDVDLLRQFVAAKLPEYMVPAALVVIDALPLTLNGKLDRGALPEPDFSASEAYCAPSTELEAQLCDVWQQVLGMERIGVKDNFFQIGGDSIVSISLISALRRAGFQLQVRDMFTAPTVAKLATLIEQQGGHAVISVQTEQGLLSGQFAQHPTQKWLFAQQLHNPHYFNQAFIAYCPAGLSQDALADALMKLSIQHDMLRCRFTSEFDNEYTDTGLFELTELNISGLSDDEFKEWLSELQGTLDIHHGPTWRVCKLVGHADNQDRLCFIFHHLIIDTVSWSILLGDLQQLVAGQKLLDKQTSYRQWVEGLNQYASANQQQTAYWQNVLSTASSYPAVQQSQQLSLTLEKAQTEALLQQANLGYQTQTQELLLSALVIAMETVLGGESHAILLEGHGREAIAADLDVSQTLGWFTSIYPVKLTAEQNVEQTLVSTKEMMRAIPDKGIGFGALYQFDVAKMPSELPKVCFNYLGQFKASTEARDWQITGESVGALSDSQNHTDTVLNILSLVKNEQLSVEVESKLPTELGQQFISAFERALEQVIAQGVKVAQAGGVATPSDYAHVQLSFPLLQELNARYNVEALYSANSLQQGFIYHALNQPDDDAYRVQLVLDYHTALDVDLYKKAWQLAATKHPALRMAFNWQEQLLQVVCKDIELNAQHFNLVDLSELTPDEREQQLASWLAHDRLKAFDLAQPGLFRITVFKQSDTHYTVLKTEHHSIGDGWSVGNLLETVNTFYNALNQGHLPQLDVENGYLAAQAYLFENKQATSDFWQQKVKQFEHANDINYLLSQSQDLSQTNLVAQPARRCFEIQGDDFTQLSKVCRDTGVTLNAAMQFTWHKLIQSYCQDKQTLVGTTVSGRDIPVSDIHAGVGLFINTLPLAVNWQPEHSIADMMLHIQLEIADVTTHSGAQLSRIQSQGAALFHTLFVFENYPIPTADDSHPERIENTMRYRETREKSDYPITVIVTATPEQVEFSLNYCEQQIAPQQAERLISQLQMIVSAIITAPQQQHSQISLLTEQQANELLMGIQPEIKIPQKRGALSEIFAKQVELYPHNIALKYQDQALTYQELNNKANQLANAIIAHYPQVLEASTDNPVFIGLNFNPGLELMISMLAILTLGATYVPLTPEYPKSRTQFILSDTETPIVLCSDDLTQELTQITEELKAPPQVLSYEQLCVHNAPEQLHNVTLSADDLAYVIYTSGTTGQPKGVMQSHHNVVRLFDASEPEYQFNDSDVWVMYHACTFDFSVWEIWGALLNGGCLVVPDKACTRDPREFITLCQTQGVTVLNQTPSAFYSFADMAVALDAQLPALRYVIFGGDKLNLARLDEWWQAYGDTQTKLINMYGITETTVHVTYQELTPENNRHQSIIGRPLRDMAAYVLDPNQNLVPVGVVGEMYVGGAGLATGYLNREELTNERFIDNPFADKIEALTERRLYRSGDLVRWLPDGQLEYIGRNDEQVKIRGFRIELGEIENVLIAHQPVKQAVVVPYKRQGNTQLIAYVVLHPSAEFSNDDAIKYLAAQLPEYMVPSTIMVIDSIPLTVNNKIDRKALPEPVFNDETDYVAPTNELESQLCEIWQALLGIEKVGVEDHFFRIGGDSIISIQLTSQLRQLGYTLKIKEIYESPTVAQLAKHIAQLPQSEQLQTEQGVLSGEFSLLPVQSWFFDLQLSDASHWNQSFMMTVPSSVSTEQVSSACRELVLHHDMMRVRFDNVNKQYQQRYLVLEEAELEQWSQVASIDVNGLDDIRIGQQLTQVQQSLDLAQGPLFKLVHLHGYRDGLARVCFIFHHLIIDGVSWRILSQDMQSLLTGKTLGNKTSSYRQWVDVMHAYPHSHSSELAYWQNTLDQNALDSQANIAIEAQVSEHELALSAEHTQMFLRQSNAGYNTEINDLLLSALSMTLSQVLSGSTHLITLEGHGREEISSTIDVSRTLGWFTSLYPVKLTDFQDLATTIIQTKEMLRRIPNKGIGYGAFYQAGLLEQKLPLVSFNYLGQFNSPNNTAEWQIVNENSGQTIGSQNEMALALNINGAVKGQQLMFSVQSRLGEALSGEFVRRFKQCLEMVIEHTKNVAEQGAVATPSDFIAKDLSVEHLAHLNTVLEQTTQPEQEESTCDNENIMEF